MATFIIDQTAREALSAERAEELLGGLGNGVKHVKLSGKSFGDGSAEVVADALQRAIPTLTHLDVADIIASRPEEEAKRTLVTISEALSSCKHLELIDLSDNALGAKGIRAVGSLLAGQDKLTELFLCNNGLAADAGKLITASLLETAPTALVKLHFHNNLLETPGSIALAPVVEQSPNLIDFRFSSLRLGRNGAVRICDALKPRLAENLKRLNISDNSFGEEGALALAEALRDAPALEELIVNDCLLEDKGTKIVCEALAVGAPRLEILNISGNEMGIGGTTGLVKVLSSGTLKKIIAEDNELGNAGAARLATGISPESGLVTVNVNSSEIGSRGAHALATAASKLENLEILMMDGNGISADTLSEIQSLLEGKLGAMDDNDEDADEESDEDETSSETESDADQSELGCAKQASVKSSSEADVDNVAAGLGKVTI